MPYEVFTRRMKPDVTEAMVTLQRKGNFSLNQTAFKLLGEPEAVELLYDRERQKVAFRPVDRSTVTAYPVRKQSQSSTYQISGEAFCAYHQIPPDPARRFIATGDTTILEIDLAGPAVEVPPMKARGSGKVNASR